MVWLWWDTIEGARVAHLTDAADIRALVQLFETIAGEEGWRPEGALQRHTAHAAYFGLQAATAPGRWVGGLQLVFPDEAGRMPYHEIWPEVSLSPAGADCLPRTAHVAMLGIAADQRGDTLLYWRLVIEMWRHCVALGITTLSLEVTPRVLPLYRRLGWPLTIAGELRPHWGEACYLCALSVADVAYVLLKRAENSRRYAHIIAQACRVGEPGASRREIPYELDAAA